MCALYQFPPPSLFNASVKNILWGGDRWNRLEVGNLPQFIGALFLQVRLKFPVTIGRRQSLGAVCSIFQPTRLILGRLFLNPGLMDSPLVEEFPHSGPGTSL